MYTFEYELGLIGDAGASNQCRAYSVLSGPSTLSCLLLACTGLSHHLNSGTPTRGGAAS